MVTSAKGEAMRILICSNAYPPHFVGGAELMAHEQAKALARKKHDVRIFTGELTSARPRYSRADDKFEDLPIHSVALVPEDYSPEYLNFLHPKVDEHFSDILSDLRPQVVHFHNLMGLSVKLPILAQQFGAQTICTLHDFWGFCLRNTAARPDDSRCDNITQCRSCLPRIHDGRKLNIPMRFRKDFISLALEHVDHFIAPSQYVSDRYVWAGLPADRLTVIRNGMDLEHFRPTPSPSGIETIRITYAGHFGAHKGVLTLLDALALLAPTMPAVTLQLAGEGPEQKNYLAKIDALGLHDHVRFLGKVSPTDMPGIYARTDIVVLPSVWDENQPVCLMEAMASGLPVVASRKGGIPELIEHGENGLMFTAGDAPDLAAQLAALMLDPDLRQTAGRKGRQRMEGLSHDLQANRYLEIYTKPASAPSPPLRSRDFYIATGSMRRKMAGESDRLADDMYPSRYFIPRKWLSKDMPARKGVVLTGWRWSALRLLGIDAIVTLPQFLLKWGDAMRRCIGRMH